MLIECLNPGSKGVYIAILIQFCNKLVVCRRLPFREMAAKRQGFVDSTRRGDISTKDMPRKHYLKTM